MRLLAVMVASLITLGLLASPAAKPATGAPSPKKTCKYVTKKVHGKKKRVKVCHTVKPKPTATATASATPSPTATATATATPSPTATATTTATATSTQVSDTVTVSASVSNPAPTRNSTVTVYGQLLVNGQGVGGVPMDTAWYYKTTTSNCSGITDSTGTASCSRDIGGATVGYMVSINVTFTYHGQYYSTTTGFTPR